MVRRVLGTSSVLLVNEALDEHDLYARTLRAYRYCVVKAPTSGAAHLIAITRPTGIVVTDVHITGSMSGRTTSPLWANMFSIDRKGDDCRQKSSQLSGS